MRDAKDTLTISCREIKSKKVFFFLYYFLNYSSKKNFSIGLECLRNIQGFALSYEQSCFSFSDLSLKLSSEIAVKILVHCEFCGEFSSLPYRKEGRIKLFKRYELYSANVMRFRMDFCLTSTVCYKITNELKLAFQTLNQFKNPYNATLRHSLKKKDIANVRKLFFKS